MIFIREKHIAGIQVFGMDVLSFLILLGVYLVMFCIKLTFIRLRIIYFIGFLVLSRFFLLYLDLDDSEDIL